MDRLKNKKCEKTNQFKKTINMFNSDSQAHSFINLLLLGETK